MEKKRPKDSSKDYLVIIDDIGVENWNYDKKIAEEWYEDLLDITAQKERLGHQGKR